MTDAKILATISGKQYVTYALVGTARNTMMLMNAQRAVNAPVWIVPSGDDAE